MVSVEDKYRFLEDPDSAETKTWIEKQKALTNGILEKCELRSTILKQLKKYADTTRIIDMERRGDYVYFTASKKLQPYPILYRLKEKGAYKVKPDLSNAEVFLDPTKFKDDKNKKTSIDNEDSSWSGDGRYYAYQAKKSGSDWATIMIRDANTVTDLPKDKLKWVKFSRIEWTSDNKGFFYNRYETPKNYKKDKSQSMNGAGRDTQKL